jgi:flavin reductase (DIM6/NTAB) family NADH-FMN oxidoreductase RutF
VAPEHYRDALSPLPTSVSIVTAVRLDAPAGCTANAVMSLSLDLPSLLVSLTTGSRTLAAVTEAGTFAVNVLAWPDRHLEPALRQHRTARALRGRHLVARPRGPVLTRSALTAVCEVTVPLLDHTIVAGTVTWLRTEDTEPTVLYRHRQYALHP